MEVGNTCIKVGVEDLVPHQMQFGPSGLSKIVVRITVAVKRSKGVTLQCLFPCPLCSNFTEKSQIDPLQED